MKKKLFETNNRRERLDGELAFTPQGRAIANRRVTAKGGGRIQKILGIDDTFADEFKSVFDPDNEHLWILERVHLEKELDATKKIIKALSKFPDNYEAQAILEDIRDEPRFRRTDCTLCPVWRHERELKVIEAAVSRYVFPQVSDQLYLVTPIFDFAEDLYQLESKLRAAHQLMKDAMTYMTKMRRGMMITGCFEPDLETYAELESKPSRRKMMKVLHRDLPDAGGWTITGHFFVRAPHVEILEEWLKSKLPTIEGWERVQVKRVRDDATLWEHLIKILGYAGKFPKSLFDVETRGEGRRQADRNMNALSAAFNGPFMTDLNDDVPFDINAAIVQWVRMMSRLGPKLIYFSYESVHAQKWLSPSEMDYLVTTGDDMTDDGEHRIEIRRDFGPFSGTTTMPELMGRRRYLRTRPLVYDEEWARMTDCEGIDLETHYHDFDRWILKQ